MLTPYGVLVIVLSSLLVLCRSQFVYDCPDDWPSFGDACYHFIVYPTLPYAEASQACHQDGASLVSVNTAEENNFLLNWLSRFDGVRLNQWLTSGTLRGGTRSWSGDGDSISTDSGYWIISPETEANIAQSVRKAELVFQFSVEDSKYGWAWVNQTRSLPYICEIKQGEVYRLYQRSRDFSYGSDSDPNSWITGPKFTVQSRSIVFAGRAEQFSIDCIADGNPVPSYKWYKDFGTENQQEVTATDRYTVTNGRLTIKDPNKQEDPGLYTCEAENVGGKVITPPVRLSAGYLGEFSDDIPGSRTAVLYEGAAIDCDPPKHNPELVFQWMKNEQFIRPELNAHTFLSENGKLYLSEVQAADAADYHCIVTLVAPQGQKMATSQPLYGYSMAIRLNIRGENPNQFGPTVHDEFPAVFPSKPMRGQDVRLECLAYGRLPLYYSWSRTDGGEMPNDRITYSSLNRILRISDARIEDSGTYNCSVEGPVRVASKEISIVVSAVPYFMFPLRDQHLDIGSQLTWVCDAVAIPKATYTWYKNGQILMSDPANDIEVVRNVVTIQRADPDKHNGMYQCMAQNDYGTQTSIAQIRVLSFKPTFAKDPVMSSLMGTVGGNLTISCRPEAAPQPTITWSHNGSPLTSSGRVQIMPNGNLVLSSLSSGDSGDYTCTAENSLGQAESSGHLSILQQTTLILTPQSQNVIQNNTAHIPCQASYAINKTDLVYAWYFNDVLIDTDYEPAFRVGESSSGVQGIYVIGAQHKHEGWYKCRAMTVYDSVSAQAYLTVHGPPEEPVGMHVHSQNGTKVTLWWQPGKTHWDAISLYHIQYNNNFNKTWVSLRSDISAAETGITQYPQWRQYVIQANFLSPGTHYKFRVSAASTQFGFGPFSKSSESIKLNDAAPIHAVSYVGGGGGSVGMLQVHWLPLHPEDHGGSGLYYRVYWRLHRHPDDMWRISEKKIYGGNPDPQGLVWFYQLVGEENFYTMYDVKVQAINDMGPGPNTTVVNVMSAEDIPVTSPQQVSTESLNASAGIVYWTLPNNTRQDMRGKVMGYQINWWHWGGKGKNCDGFENREIIRFIRHYGPDMQGTVIGLAANDDYWVNVQVFNTAGLSQPSGCSYLSTNYEAPLHYPDFVNVVSNGRESVRVSWRGVSTVQIESPVSGYKVWYWPATDDIRTAKVAKFPKVFTGVIHGIEKDTIYELRILGTSLGGDGKKTPPTFFTLGGLVRYDPLTTEVMASASILKPSVLFILVCLSLLAVPLS